MNPWHIDLWELTIRLLVAIVLGGLIGFERERSNHPAGFRTHILVCLGSALLMVLSIYGFSQFVDEPNVRIDPARLAAQVIPGIGFLGAGTILRHGFSVTGLTTAASLWIASAIGLAVGAGFYYGAAISTGFALASLWMLNIVQKKYFSDKRNYTIKVNADFEHGLLAALSAKLEANGYVVRSMSVNEAEAEGGAGHRIEVSLIVRNVKPSRLARLSEDIRSISGVRSVSIDTM